MSPLSVIVNDGLIGLNLRSAPRIAANTILKRLPPGTQLISLEDDAATRAKAGAPEQWLNVRDPAGVQGYVAAAYVHLGEAVPPAQAIALVVNPDLDVFVAGGLSLRDAAPNGAVIDRLPPGAEVTSLEPPDVTRAKAGAAGQWLNVRDSQGQAGFVAAWLVHLRDELPPDVIAQGVVIAVAGAPLLDAPAPGSPSSWRVTAGTPLYVVETGDWPSRLGRPDQYLHVRSYALKDGYVTGAQVSAPGSTDTRAPAVDQVLPYGDSAWLYGLHDPYDRGLFAGSGRTGWVLFTEQVASGAGNPAYQDWARANGYGVIARLNNDYGGTGTIPVPSQYDAFAAQCAQWVRRSPGCHTWVIGNEMNNPREWPEEGRRPDLAISPESYADCFNRTRAAIKAAQPDAIVIPGAVDPYQGPSISCLDWLQRMLAAIDDLDGIALHCYTQGYEPGLITDLGRFGDDPLKWQYYHFRCYTTFIDVIPPRWRGVPIYITETDPHGAQPWSGGQNGWTQAAYAEINRWNQQPFSQQIRALVLYRWSRDDRYSISDKPGVQADIRATVQLADYRWRR